MINVNFRPGWIAAGFAALSLNAMAAQDGELWEVASQMNMPGLPAGMGAQKVTVCKGPKDDVARDPQASKCKVTDTKRSANRVTISMSCPDGDATMDYSYNAAHTEYKGTMRMVQRGREMTMNMTGRKLGACDPSNPQDTRAKANAQAADIQARSAVATKDVEQKTIQACDSALERMQLADFQGASAANCKPGSQMFTSMSRNPVMKNGFAHCCTQVGAYCRRYQTQEGFAKVRGAKEAAEFCGLSYAQVKAPLCKSALQSESLDFLVSYCPAEAKVVAQRECVGRDFTALMAGKYGRLCHDYLANRDFEKNSAGDGAQPASRPAADAGKAQATSAPSLPDPGEAVNQGINKLKGLFGR